MKSWVQQLDGQLDSTGLSFIINEQEHNLREIIKLVKERCNDMDRQNMVSDISENVSLLFYRDINFSRDRKSYIESCTRKERDGIAWLLTELCKLRGIKRNVNKRICPLYLDNEGVKRRYICWPVQKHANAILNPECLP